jgi:hypothetical protein
LYKGVVIVVAIYATDPGDSARISVETSSTEVVTGKKFSPARVLACGGLILSKKTKMETTREGFFHVYAADTVFVVRETAVNYAGLGDRLPVSRAANFLALLAVLRARAAGAAFDDRLLRRVGQAQILGPMLDPLRYVRLASILIGLFGRRPLAPRVYSFVDSAFYHYPPVA